MDGGTRSFELLKERIASIPEGMRQALADDGPLAMRDRFVRPHGELTLFGAGGSAGPARLLAASLRAAGWQVSLAAPSCFALDRRGHEGALCVVSQGLSPNARLVLGRERGPTLLVTAVADAPPSAEVLRHGPAAENDMLVRVVGPALASLAAVRFAGVADEAALAALPDAVAAARCAAPDGDFEHIVLITAGDYQDVVEGLRWKLLETLALGDPPIYDVLQFAHGPFQQLFDRRALVVVFDRGTLEEQSLFMRLGAMLVPERHALLRLRATLPFPLCWFEHDAQLNQLVLELLRRAPRDLIDWPGKGRDASLYGLDH